MVGPATGSSFSHVSPCRHPKYAAHAVPLVGGGDGGGRGWSGGRRRPAHPFTPTIQLPERLSVGAAPTAAAAAPRDHVARCERTGSGVQCLGERSRRLREDAMDLTLTTPALLFPAISLLLLA